MGLVQRPFQTTPSPNFRARESAIAVLSRTSVLKQSRSRRRASQYCLLEDAFVQVAWTEGVLTCVLSTDHWGPAAFLHPPHYWSCILRFMPLPSAKGLPLPQPPARKMNNAKQSKAILEFRRGPLCGPIQNLGCIPLSDQVLAEAGIISEYRISQALT